MLALRLPLAQGLACHSRSEPGAWRRAELQSLPKANLSPHGEVRAKRASNHEGVVQVTVYILRCCDGSYYTGLTRGDADARAWEHNTDPYRRIYGPPAASEACLSGNYERLTDAIARERRIKGWSRAKKEALMRGDYDGLLPLSSRPSRRASRAPQDEG